MPTRRSLFLLSVQKGPTFFTRRRLLLLQQRKKYTIASSLSTSSYSRYYYSSLSEPSAVGGLPPIINETSTETKTTTAGSARPIIPTATTTATTPLPKRIILLRHGESLGNVDENSYSHIPDWKIPLTRRGERQSLKAATDLIKVLQSENEDCETLFTYCSPYKRTHETWDIMRDYIIEDQKQKQHQTDNKNNNEENSSSSSSNNNNNNNNMKQQQRKTTTTRIELLGTREEPRIAEQQFGNFQNPHKVRTAKAERRTFGRFFFRFPNGEAGLDVYNRVSSFWATVSRDLVQLQSITDIKNLNILIVTHGLTLRLLLMRYFQLSVEEFEHSYNSQNAKLVIMERKYCYVGGGDSDDDDDDDNQILKEYFQLQDEAKDALNLKGDISNNLPVYWRGDALEQKPYDRED